MLHKSLREGIQKRLAGHNHETIAKLLKKAVALETECAKKAKPATPKPAKEEKGNGRGKTPKPGAEGKKEGTKSRSNSRPVGLKCFSCTRFGHMSKDCKNKTASTTTYFK